MLQRIAATPAPGDPDYPWGLRELRTRASDDYAITVLEMWATVADILSFYQERFANEAYLRTATLRDSVTRLARLVDYQPRPGVAATTLLAFTLDPAAVLLIPARLRVQSVPAEGQKPQKFETLSSLEADCRLNRLPLRPCPVRVEPFVPGATQAFLAPGAIGAADAARSRPGDRVLILSAGGTTAIEELTIRDVSAADGLGTVTWQTPVSVGGAQAQACPVGRTFKVFGHDAPASYVVPVVAPSPPGGLSWDLKLTTFGYPGPGSTREDGQTLFLDAQYEGIKVGSSVLVCQRSGGTTSVNRVTVTGVSQGADEIGPLSATVTRLVVTGLAPLADRRDVVIYEAIGNPLQLWPWAYPSRLTGTPCFVPGVRSRWNAIDVGGGAFIEAEDLEPGRPLLLTDGSGTVASGTIVQGTLVGADVRFAPHPLDQTSAAELGLATDRTRQVTALASAALATVPAFRSPAPEIFATIGGIGPRRIVLPAASSLIQLSNALQAALRAADPAPEFSRAMVRTLGPCLIVLAGVPGKPVVLDPTPTDPTTLTDLGFDAGRARFVDAILSAPLEPFLPPSQANPRLEVTFGSEQPLAVTLGARPTTLVDARNMLETAIQSAPSAPSYVVLTQVDTLGDSLLVLPGLPDPPARDFLRLDLDLDPIDLDARTAVLLGNVAPASHGESVKTETLGDGDVTALFQRFPLSKKPLTWVPAAAGGGLESSLQVLVDGTRWSEIPTLYGRGPTEQVYLTRVAEDGTTSVQFGDGQTGARPATGRGNIAATYRQGSGLEGRVQAGVLTNLLDRPVGLKSVVNPLPTDGGADRETLANARTSAPATVRTFGRAVSLRDFADIATATGEVAKASATSVWSGESRAVHLTVAGQKGGLFSRAALARLHAAITAQRDPNHQLLLDNFVRVPVVVAATLRVSAVRVAAEVQTGAAAALAAALGFEVLAFGRPVHLSDLYAVLQEVSGVESVDIDLLQFKDRSASNLASRGASSDPVQEHLRIYPARMASGQLLPAEQAWVEDPASDLALAATGGMPD
jgi:hypothetical protein